MFKKTSTFLRNTKNLMITFALFAVFSLVAVIVFNSSDHTISKEQSELLEHSLYSAAINWYAVNGRYPTLEEIKNDYGLVLDSDYYEIRYSTFASNIIPDIRVIPIEELNR